MSVPLTPTSHASPSTVRQYDSWEVLQSDLFNPSFPSQFKQSLFSYVGMEQWDIFLQQHPLPDSLPILTSHSDLLTFMATYRACLIAVMEIGHHWIPAFESRCTNLVQAWTTLCQRFDYGYYDRYFQDTRVMLTEKQQVWKALNPLETLLDQSHIQVWQKAMKKSENSLAPLSGSLNESQWKAATWMSTHALVLAGAGSGKTTTLTARLQYLLKTQHVAPHQILALAFTNAAADSIREKVAQQIGIEIEVKTFHKLGIDLISQTLGYRPGVADESELILFIEDYLKTYPFQQSEWSQELLHFFAYYLQVDALKEKETLASHYQQRDFPRVREARAVKSRHRTLQGEFVRSAEECQIANFLYLNQVSYQYEPAYEVSTASSKHRQYHPDFYLPQCRAYLEHFGVDEEGQVKWLAPDKAMRYTSEMEWKRQLHQYYQTDLIETYSYQVKNGEVFDALTRQLLVRGIELCPRAATEVHQAMRQSKGSPFAAFTQLVYQAFQGLSEKENALPILDDWMKPHDTSYLAKRQACFATLIYPMWIAYQQQLIARGEVGVEGIIRQATEVVSQVALPYTHLLIDEVQDISANRLAFLEAIWRQTNATFFAVGDDWQSIFRFSGSDWRLLQSFSDRFGMTQALTLNQTYRLSQEAVTHSSAFVMKNPQQSRKKLQSTWHHAVPYYHVPYEAEHGNYPGCDKQSRLKTILAEIVQQHGETAEVFLLGRYHSDLMSFQPDIQRNNRDSSRVTIKEYPQLNLHFYTIHQAKGLEADVVVLLNNQRGYDGFPSYQVSDPLLVPLLPIPESYLFAEERRLFYVAMTRAKYETYFLAPLQSPSLFIEEALETQMMKTIPLPTVPLPVVEPESRVTFNALKNMTRPHARTNRFANQMM